MSADLEEQIKALQEENNTLKSQVSEPDLKAFEQIRELRAENKKHKDEVRRLTGECMQLAFRARELENDLKESRAETERHRSQELQLDQSLKSVELSLDEMTSSKERLEADLTEHKSQVVVHQEELERQKSELERRQSDLEKLQSELSQRETRINNLEKLVNDLKDQFLSGEMVAVSDGPGEGQAFRLLAGRMEDLLGFPGRTMVEQVFKLSRADLDTTDLDKLEDVFEALQDTAGKLVPGAEMQQQLNDMLEECWAEVQTALGAEDQRPLAKGESAPRRETAIAHEASSLASAAAADPSDPAAAIMASALTATAASAEAHEEEETDTGEAGEPEDAVEDNATEPEADEPADEAAEDESAEAGDSSAEGEAAASSAAAAEEAQGTTEPEEDQIQAAPPEDDAVSQEFLEAEAAKDLVEADSQIHPGGAEEPADEPAAEDETESEDETETEAADAAAEEDQETAEAAPAEAGDEAEDEEADEEEEATAPEASDEAAEEKDEVRAPETQELEAVSSGSLEEQLEKAATPAERKALLLDKALASEGPEAVELLLKADDIDAITDRDGQLAFELANRLGEDTDITDYVLDYMESVEHAGLFDDLQRCGQLNSALTPVTDAIVTLARSARPQALTVEGRAGLAARSASRELIAQIGDPDEEELVETLLDNWIPKAGLSLPLPSESFARRRESSAPAAFVGTLRQALRNVDYTMFDFHQLEVLSYDGDEDFLVDAAAEPNLTLLFHKQVDALPPEELRFLVFRRLVQMYRRHTTLAQLAEGLDDQGRTDIVKAAVREGSEELTEELLEESEELPAEADRATVESLLRRVYAVSNDERYLDLAGYLYDNKLMERRLDPIADHFATRVVGLTTASYATLREGVDETLFERAESSGMRYLFELDDPDLTPIRLRLQRLWLGPLEEKIS